MLAGDESGSKKKKPCAEETSVKKNFANFLGNRHIRRMYDSSIEIIRTLLLVICLFN